MHDIPELTRQYDAAKSRAREADRVAEEAETMLNDALCEQKLDEFRAAGGVVGKTKVKLPSRSDEYVVMGARIYYGNAFFEVFKVKKDGTPCARHVPAWAVEIIR